MIEIYLDIKNCFVKLEYAAEILKILPDDKSSSFDASCDGGSLLQFLNDKKVLLSFLSSIFFRKLLIFPLVGGSGRLMKDRGDKCWLSSFDKSQLDAGDNESDELNIFASTCSCKLFSTLLATENNIQQFETLFCCFHYLFCYQDHFCFF